MEVRNSLGVVKRQEKELNNFYEDDEDFEEDGLEVLEQGKYFLLGNVLQFVKQKFEIQCQIQWVINVVFIPFW